MPALNIRQTQNALFFLVGAFCVYWVGTSHRFTTPFEALRAVLLLMLFSGIKFFFLKKIPSPTPSGSIVMAIGIFINGALVHFPRLERELAAPLTLTLFIILLFIIFSYIGDARRGDFFRLHLADPVGRFAAGTWVAAISVCGIAICQRLPQWRPLVQLMVLGNITFWLYFMFQAIAGFRKIFATAARRKVHGVLLLATVSTQSLVNVWIAAFGTSKPYELVAPWVIGFGAALYFVGFYLIVRRYGNTGRKIDLDKEWFNTNCIIHGAMSITGLACAIAGVIPADLTLLVWLWVLCWFVIIETVEITRALKRSIRYGVVDALLVYNPTQWSRNFTFGMLYAFSLNFKIAESSADGTFLITLHQTILRYFGWVVLLLLLLEITVFLLDRLALAPKATLAGT